MAFSDNYVKDDERLQLENQAKTVLTNEGFAIGELLEELTASINKLTKKIEHVRVKK